MRVNEGKEFQEREQLRICVLVRRILHVLQHVSNISQSILDLLLNLLENLQLAELKLRSSLSDNDIETMFMSLQRSIEELIARLAPMTPKHRPIDIQTSDAGPGVGTKEQLVVCRLTESFIINDLDLIARFHYAPRDSKAHKVEQVMSALNEACGDGRFIDIPKVGLNEEELLKSTQDITKLKEAKQKEVNVKCAETLAGRYEGTRCMGTTIHTRVPSDNNPHDTFYFDEKYLRECHLSWSSVKKRQKCPGIHYFEYLKEQEKKIFIKYNNGIEGVRHEGRRRCPSVVERVPPPVPNWGKDGDGVWHYHRLGEMPEGYSVEQRSPDDFNPFVQITNFVNSFGDPIIEKTTVNGTTCYTDINMTWSALMEEKDDFVKKYIGNDLHDVAVKEMEQQYLRKLQKCLKKGEKLSDVQLKAIQTGELKIQITKPKCPAPMPWNTQHLDKQMINTCTIDNALYILHVAQTFRPELERMFMDSQDSTLELLAQIHQAFQKKMYSYGKFLWLRQFEKFDMSSETWDAHGSEDEHFFITLRDQTTTCFTSSCSDSTCKKPVILRSGSVVAYRYI